MIVPTLQMTFDGRSMNTTEAQNTSTRSFSCGATVHASAAATAFDRINASKNASLPQRLKSPESSPEKAYAIVKNGVPPVVRSIARPNTVPTVQPVIMPQRSELIMIMSTAAKRPTDRVSNKTNLDSAIMNTATVMSTAVERRISADSVVGSSFLSASAIK